MGLYCLVHFHNANMISLRLFSVNADISVLTLIEYTKCKKVFVLAQLE